MFYRYDGELKEIEYTDIAGDALTIGYLRAENLSEVLTILGLPGTIAEKCCPADLPFRSSVETYDDFTLATLKIVGENLSKEEDRIGMVFRSNLLLVVDILDSDGSTRDVFFDTLKRLSAGNLTLEKTIVGFFDRLTADDIQRIEDINEDIHALESEIINDRIGEDFNSQILQNEEYILKLHYYYEHMLDIVQSLDENENDILRDGKMLYISNLVRRLERLREDTDSLKNTVEHLQDAYYSYLDTQMNKTMKILTVLTTLFFPLTIIVGWYGMNFAAMPELTWKYGYIYVILLSVVVVLLLWRIGKKKNWFR